MTVSAQYPILSKPIPEGGFGRSLTSTEVRKLRACGVPKVSTRCVVVQAGAPHIGTLYRPNTGGGLANAYVTCRLSSEG